MISPLESALRPVAGLLNRNIRATTPARELCKQLDGAVVAVRVSNTALAASFIVHEDHLELTTEISDDPDVLISGSLLTLARMAGDSGSSALRDGSLEMAGDVLLAEKFQQLLDFAKPDVEEELSGLVGDAAAYRLGEFARSVGKWSAQARDTMSDNIREYLQEESRDLPSRYEVDRFTANVDALRDDVERLAARIERLQGELMASRQTLFRLIAIQRVLVKYSLDDIIKETHLLRPLRFLFYLAPRRRDRSAPIGERIRLALEELGPIFVKFGQAISTRRDLLPPDIADELAKLQDAVPPFPAEQAIEIIDDAYEQSVNEVFKRFDVTPLAAASIAQVHTAQLQDDTEVIVKVLRPGVQQQIERDLDVLRALAGLADRYWEHGKRLKPLEIVDEYEHTIIDELDLMREAANAAQLKHNFQDSDMLYVPAIYWDYCRPEVLVQERIFGTQISDMKALRDAGTNIKKLAENGVEIFFTQVFRHNFFHADMHPGNIFVLTSDPENPKYAAVDFGIVGSLSPEDQRYLAENFLAFFDRNYHRIAKLHLDSGWVPAGTRIDQLESAVRTVCEPIFNKPLAEISFAQVLIRLFRVAQRFDVEIQPQMILLHKTLFNIEGLGRELYPQLDLWETAQPVLRRWMDEQVGGRAMLRDVRENLPQLRDALRELPAALQQLGEQAASGKMQLGLQSPELEAIQRQLAAQRRQRYWLTVAAVGVIAGTLVATLGSTPWLGWPILAAGIAAGIAAK